MRLSNCKISQGGCWIYRRDGGFDYSSKIEPYEMVAQEPESLFDIHLNIGRQFICSDIWYSKVIRILSFRAIL